METAREQRGAWLRCPMRDASPREKWPHLCKPQPWGVPGEPVQRSLAGSGRPDTCSYQQSPLCGGLSHLPHRQPLGLRRRMPAISDSWRRRKRLSNSADRSPGCRATAVSSMGLARARARSWELLCPVAHLAPFPLLTRKPGHLSTIPGLRRAKQLESSRDPGPAAKNQPCSAAVGPCRGERSGAERRLFEGRAMQPGWTGSLLASAPACQPQPRSKACWKDSRRLQAALARGPSHPRSWKRQCPLAAAVAAGRQVGAGRGRKDGSLAPEQPGPKAALPAPFSPANSHKCLSSLPWPLQAENVARSKQGLRPI
ncbi:uncharacterized protein LOC112549681 [Alligator sinensis]|uniref:Uncharacterized protein LOC112549681 n=1 Tax=Alligator sinensis TaxID=38654 RepID=A0A3Q0G722_ALLSI|nr:uncharacterized protein LOC112549681 [Alligator sinensis]